MTIYPSYEEADVTGKRVLLRVDLNVPMHNGRVTETTRINRLLPSIQLLSERGAKVIVLSHFGRPKGAFNPDMSLAPLVDILSQALELPVKFATDCVGHVAEEAVASLKDGEVLLLENLRFHKEEEANNLDFAKALAKLGDIFVSEAFSCAHRAHASIVPLAELLPAYAGPLMLDEITRLTKLFTNPDRPIAAVVGGSKVSTKIDLLQNLATKMDMLVIGGAMANTFLHAQGYAMGKSLYEPDHADTARAIMEISKKSACEIILPCDAVVAETLTAGAECEVVDIDKVPANQGIFDTGPQSIAVIKFKLANCQTVVWNGPIGAFEITPFDVGTISIARAIAGLTASGTVSSIAGGGDTLAAIARGGLRKGFSYLSTAGGAFLEWLEGKELPGVAVLARG
jgi:phosphoglycerate kinase